MRLRVQFLLGFLLLAGAVAADTKPSVVLVHGAWADGTGWQSIVRILERDGYRVTAVQNPLTSYAEDVATTKRVIDAEALRGPVVVVGHSYGGAVMSAAATHKSVAALIYIAAFAPDEGEILGKLAEREPSLLLHALVPDSAGFLYIDRAHFRKVFMADVSAADSAVMAAAQKPIAHTTFGAPALAPAWKSVPSWYLVSTEDQTINPALQRFMAKRMGAVRVDEIKASHVAYVARPKQVAAFITAAIEGRK